MGYLTSSTATTLLDVGWFAQSTSVVIIIIFITCVHFHYAHIFSAILSSTPVLFTHTRPLQSPHARTNCNYSSGEGTPARTHPSCMHNTTKTHAHTHAFSRRARVYLNCQRVRLIIFSLVGHVVHGCARARVRTCRACGAMHRECNENTTVFN